MIVDNGIFVYKFIVRVWEFGLNVIIIDYYDILFELLFVNVIFNFKFIFEIFFY